MLEVLLILNAIWFSMAFHLFSLRSRIFAKLVIPRENRQTPVFETFHQSVRFLGGFNFAFALLSILLLLNLDTFPNDSQRAILLVVIAVAHGSQFLGNVPIAIDNKRGTGVWQVFKGLMLFIFITDFTLMLLNLIFAAMFTF